MPRDRQRSNAKSRGHREAVKLYSLIGKRCKVCGATENLTRDHVDHNPDNNAPSNIQVLCRSCHGRKDSKYRWRNHDKTRTCVVCRSKFDHKRSETLTCSESCRRELQWETRRKRSAA